MILILWNIIISTNIHFCTVAPSVCWQWTMLSLSYIHLLDHLVCNHCFHLCKHTNMPSYTNIRTYFLFIVSSHWYTKILVRYICSNLRSWIRWCISGASPLTAWYCPLPHCWGEQTFFMFYEVLLTLLSCRWSPLTRTATLSTGLLLAKPLLDSALRY